MILYPKGDHPATKPPPTPIAPNAEAIKARVILSVAGGAKDYAAVCAFVRAGGIVANDDQIVPVIREQDDKWRQEEQDDKWRQEEQDEGLAPKPVVGEIPLGPE
jgi:hypothetical protein